LTGIFVLFGNKIFDMFLNEITWAYIKDDELED
jgi:hypothetical protein